MSDSVKAALILAVALVIAAFINGGIYQVVTSSSGVIHAYRLNRFTGSMGLILSNRELAVEPLSTARPTSTPTP